MMTAGNSGMRKGLSLVEMMIAIILFGVISLIGYKYSSNFYDTKLSAKRALTASLIEQGTQLSNAYDIYTMQFGMAPTDETNLTQPNVRILTSIPTTITEIGTAGWDLNTSIDADNDGASDDVAFEFDVTNTGTADDDEYCAMLNNIVTPSVDLNTTLFTLANYNQTTVGNVFCYGTAAGSAPYKMVFVKEIN